MFKHNRVLSVMLGLGIMAIISEGTAHSGATGIVKERMDAMGLLGDHAKAMGDMLKNKRPFDNDAVLGAASAFVMHGERIPSLFPDTEKSRTGSKTEALPAIWSEWDDFVALARGFTVDSRTFATVASGLSNNVSPTEEQGRAIRAAFFRAAKGCSGCHERYRLDQD